MGPWWYTIKNVKQDLYVQKGSDLAVELMQLRYFQKVARTGSITRAAQELYVSQPTVSQSINRLENSLGCPLFLHQPGKSLQLNDAGILFLEKVDQALGKLEEGVNLVRERSERACVSLASSITDLCSTLILDYFERNPEVRISQRLVEINSITDLLLGDEVDFAITPCPLFDPRLDCLPLYTEELFAVVGPTHPLYGRRTVSREDLARERFLCNYSEADRNCLDMIYEQEDAQVDVLLETNEAPVIRGLVHRGDGVALMPARIVMRRVENDELPVESLLRITGYTFDTPTCISRKRSRYLLKSASEFYDYIVDYCVKEAELVRYFIHTLFG